MTDRMKKTQDTEARKRKGSREAASSSHPKEGKQVKASGKALERANRENEENESSAKLEAGWKALTPEERSRVIMEDFADYRADGGLLASARYHTGIQKEVPKFRRSVEILEGGIPNPFEDEISDEGEENRCIESALDAGNERPASHPEHCECKECAEHNATQPLDALNREEESVFYKMEDIMCRLAETSNHPALTDHVFNAFGKYYGAIYNVSGETMDQLHVVYHDDCECQICRDYAAKSRVGVVPKTPIVTTPAVRPHGARVGTMSDFEDHPGWI